jgi:hypothetical protein
MLLLLLLAAAAVCASSVEMSSVVDEPNWALGSTADHWRRASVAWSNESGQDNDWVVVAPVKGDAADAV